MRKIICFFYAIFFISSALKVNAQEAPLERENSFSLSGQLRSRFEYRHGDFTPLSKNEEPAILILNRLRLNLDYAYTDLLKTKITFQNVNIWGQANPLQTLDKSGNSLSVFEAWADLKIYKNLRTKVGRQTIALDDERLFGISNWTNSGRSHDALSFNFEKKKYQISAYFAFNQNYEALNYNNNANNPTGNLYNTTDAQSYKTMQTLWAKYNMDSYSNLSFLLSNIGFQNADSLNISNTINNLQTIGMNYFFNYPKIYGNISGYYQLGKSIPEKNTDAYLFSASIGTKIRKDLKFSVGTDYLSGNTFGKNSATNHSFQTLFGTGHKFYGNMDYFYAGNQYKDVGLMDNFLKIQYDIQSKIKVNVDGHLFFATSDIYTNNRNYSNNLGQEIDLSFEFKVNQFVELSAGYSTYFTSPSLLLLKNVSDAKSYQNWAWLSLYVHPEFFKTIF